MLFRSTTIGELDVNEWNTRVSCIRNRTLSTRKVNRERIKIHVGMTRCTIDHDEFIIKTTSRETDDSDEKMGRSVIVQFVFKEGYFCVEQDRVWFGEFGEGDGVTGIVGIGVCPRLRIGRGCVMMSGIGGRVRPVVRFRRDGGG